VTSNIIARERVSNGGNKSTVWVKSNITRDSQLHYYPIGTLIQIYYFQVDSNGMPKDPHLLHAK
jgi:hypothetical protein